MDNGICQGIFANADGNAGVSFAQRRGEAACEGHFQVEPTKDVGSCENFVGCAFKSDASLLQDDDTIGLGGFFHEVGDHDDGHAPFVQFFAHAHKTLAPARIKHGGCFVKNEDFRIHGQNAGNGDALLLAARKRVGLVLLEADETNFFKRRANAQGYFRRFNAEIFRTEGDVVFDERGDELIVGVLKHHARRGADRV